MTDIVKRLLPCPFCGGTDDENNACQTPKVTTQSFMSPIRKTAYRVECACGSYGPSDLVWSKAREMWNSRPVAVSQGASVKDEMLAFFLAFFDGWPADAQLTVTNLEALDRAREKVAALSSAERAGNQP